MSALADNGRCPICDRAGCKEEQARLIAVRDSAHFAARQGASPFSSAEYNARLYRESDLAEEAVKKHFMACKSRQVDWRSRALSHEHSIAAMDPWAWNDSGQCLFCGAFDGSGDRHQIACLWKFARDAKGGE